MASPGDFKGQRRGACGHIMAAFDLHERCARCREKKLGEDPCVKDKPSVFILLRVSASFVAILGRKDAYTL